MWTKYFTSSKIVQEYREKYGEPDIVEIRQTFDDSLQAREWEHSVIDRLQADESIRWLNVTNGQPPNRSGLAHSMESRRKMSVARLGNQNAKGRRKSIRSESHRKHISEAKKGKHNYTPNESIKKKISESLIGSFFITDGESVKRVGKGASIPNGWVRGKRK